MWKVKHLQHSSSISFVQESRSVQSKLLGLERTERLILRILLFLLEANWVITEELGMNLDNVELDMLGSCKEEALDTGNFSRIRILMRFLTVLMCSKVVQPSSLLVVFETLLSSAATTVDEEKGNPSWQACADFYITCILSCLPWGGSELVEIQFFLAALKALSRKEIHYGAYATSEQVTAAGDLCAICQEKMHAPILLRCKHIFCEDCVSEWFERERTCPLCRALVKPADLRSFGDGSTSLFFQLF